LFFFVSTHFIGFIFNLFFLAWLGGIVEPEKRDWIPVRAKPIKKQVYSMSKKTKKGERGIRTLDSLFKTIPVFKTGAINHSAISPKDHFYFIPPNRTWPLGVDTPTHYL
jgi:hypothetical protein